MSYQYDTSKNAKSFTNGSDAKKVFGYDRKIEGITLHWWGDPNQNPTYEGIVNYLCNSSNVSAHLVVTGTNRRAACIVNYSDAAWHAGSAWGNARTIGIELDPRGRAEDIDTVAEVIADIRSAFGDVPLYWHSYFTATACPGVYKNLLEKIDQLSYTKQSNAQWGQVTEKNPKAPQPTTPAPEKPADNLLKVLDSSGKQVAAYSVEANAYRRWVEDGKTGKIMQNGKDVTGQLIAKYTTPSPTTKDPDGTKQPDSGTPAADRPDYSEANNTILKQILTIVQTILEKLTSIFK